MIPDCCNVPMTYVTNGTDPITGVLYYIYKCDICSEYREVLAKNDDQEIYR